MKINRGVIRCAKKVVLYGPEGIGKSTFAGCFPDPVFIDTEGSTRNLDVARFDADFSDWQNILDAADAAVKEGGMKTLVLDTTDWAEQACIRMLNTKHGTDNILTMDYGKGSLFVVAEFEKLLSKLSELIKQGINVVLTAHATMRKQELPDEMGAFDRWELKLQSKQVKAMVKEWADMVLFANYKTFVVEDDKTKSKKAQGGKRVMYTTHHPAWDAKNRYGLDECIPFEYGQIESLIEDKAAAKPKGKAPSKQKEEKSKAEKPKEAPSKEEKLAEPEAPPKDENKAPDVFDELKTLMERDGVTDTDIRAAISDKKAYPYETQIKDYDPVFVKKNLIDQWAKFSRYCKNQWMRVDDSDAEAIPFNA